jgi:hypothetical protein
MTSDNARYRDNIDDAHEQSGEMAAEAERKEHGEERELPPKTPAKPAQTPPDDEVPEGERQES